MKKLLLLSGFTALLLFTIKEDASAQLGGGAGVAFGSDIEQVGLHGDLYYRLPSQPAIRVGGGLIYYFPKTTNGVDHDFFELNLNGNYIFYEEFMFKSYGLAGLNYSRAKVSAGNGSHSEGEIGLNLGVGGEYDFGPLLGFGELKYVVSEFDQAVFSIGVRFGF